MQRLEVWGDPIGHSRSPRLHTAAYRALGLDWEYGRRQVNEASFDRELVTARRELRGLSLTMPLKESAWQVAGWRDVRALRTGVANTLLLTGDEPAAFNTDIGGFIGALRENGVEAPERARIVGAGATAVSAVIALAETGVRELEIVARSPQKAAALVDLAADLGLSVSVRALGSEAGLTDVDATIATLPGGTRIDDAVAEDLAQHGGALVDAVYAPWPTQLGEAWIAAGRPAASGVQMLLHQALLQVRIFVTGQVVEPLESESVILDAMRSALMGD
ncbi:shikimate dehydrogenase family protein [Microbacterium gorillae]|uniref:shikimate dehydrogenase family protein n=1 Tax=Microbacterium gorillae TaxID=1231063 RepID=UPI003D980911